MVANVNRVFNKLDGICATFSSKRLHIFCATESWLSSHYTDDAVAIDNCTLFRSDRSDGRQGGGVAVWVKNNLLPLRFQLQGPEQGTDSLAV